MAVMNANQVCQHCGKPLGDKAVQGLCPECFLRVGLGTDAPVTAAPSDQPHGFVPPTPDELAGHFPQLDILECVGRGGMGAVYKAKQKGLDRLVALKVLPPESSRAAAFAERFTREARALAHLSHPNIVTIYDFGHVGGFFYFVMEFVDGVNLRQMLHAQRLSPRLALSIVPQICEALQYAHDHGIVHRDIKPENVLVDNQNRVKIADFGLAKILGYEQHGERLTRSADVMGTPHYMAPEQLEKPLQVDHRADIYSLGVVFYEMLTGELPLGRFAAPSKKVQVDVRLDEIVLRTLEKEPARRYQQAIHVSTDVEGCAADTTKPSSLPTNPISMKPQTQKFLWVLLGLVISLGLVAIASVVLYLTQASPHPPPTAVGTNLAQLTQEGWQLWQARRPAEATEKFQQAVKLAPDDANAWNGLGWAALNSGRWQEAEKAFQTVLELQPNHPAALNGLGQIYLSQGKYDQAESYLLKAAPQAPAAWYGLARVYLIQGKFLEAEKYAQKIVDSGQGDETANKMLQAARDKKLSDALRVVIEPPAKP
jgi:tetratricopeptide (TPR) repeat protein